MIQSSNDRSTKTEHNLLSTPSVHALCAYYDTLLLVKVDTIFNQHYSLLPSWFISGGLVTIHTCILLKSCGPVSFCNTYMYPGKTIRKLDFKLAIHLFTYSGELNFAMHCTAQHPSLQKTNNTLHVYVPHVLYLLKWATNKLRQANKPTYQWHQTRLCCWIPPLILHWAQVRSSPSIDSWMLVIVAVALAHVGFIVVLNQTAM